MAIRPVFVANSNGKLCDREMVEFLYFNGFAVSQKKKCVHSLHESFQKDYPERKVLEISRYSDHELGIRLSAFNLPITLSSGKKVSVECAFQAGKVFEHGGPYLDLLDKTSKEAKSDPRLKNSGRLVHFIYEDEVFDSIPQTFFYHWLYMNALYENSELAEQVIEYDAFTDMAFNPEKQINCQAEAVALFVALKGLGLLEEALHSREDFVRIVYKEKLNKTVSAYEEMRIKEKRKEMSGTSVDEVKKEEIQEKYKSVFVINDTIRHPKFGTGKILEIQLREKTAMLTVEFGTGIKKIDEVWLLKLNKSVVC